MYRNISLKSISAPIVMNWGFLENWKSTASISYIE